MPDVPQAYLEISLSSIPKILAEEAFLTGIRPDQLESWARPLIG
jgi:hypothetical protein